MAVNTESIPPSHTNGVIEDGYDEDDKAKVRPADIDADMREMERRKRVELIMNSRLFREELERIIESQIKAGNNSAGLLQQISDMVGSRYTGASNHLFRNASCAVPINDIRGVESMGYVKGEKFLRCKLAALFRLIDLYGWTQNIYNHVTARLSQQEEHFLVNPYGLLYSEVTASSLVKVDMQGNVIESGTTNFSVNVAGFRLHAAIYSARPDLKCIVHIHTPSVIAVSSLKDGLLPICQEAAVIGDISHHSYIGIPNDPEEQDKIVRNLGPNNKVIFLTNHGALCCGATIEETFFYAYNTVNACETQLKVLPLGKDNLVFLSDEMRKSMYDAARKMPDSISPPVSNVPSAAAATEKRWRIGGLEFEALMRMLDNAGFRTGYVYRQPLIKGELPRPRNDVEVPPAVSSLGYLLEEEELYKGQWKKAFGGKGNDRIRWLNSPNVYQKVEILETGTADPKKITKWVDANNEEWVADGSPSHTSTPVKIENALQFVPKNTNPKEFKKLQQQIKENRRADKITSGPQSHILEGVSWEEAKKLQDANISGTSDQVILVGAASKGIIQREYQHNATVYKTPYAKNPFDAITDEEIENYKKDITRKQRGDSYYDEDESDALSSSLPPSEMRVIQIETTTVPKASQAEVVLSDDNYDYYTEELEKFIVRIWEIKKMRPILKTIGESLRPVRSSDCVKDDDSSAAAHRPNMNEMFKQIAHELMTRFKQGSLFKQRPARPEFLPVPPTSPEFHNVSLKSASFDCSGTEITTLIELPASRGKYSRGSLESVHDFSSDPTTEDEEEPMSPENDMEGERGFLSLSSYVGHEYENPEESSEMNTSTTKTAVSDDTSADEDTVVCKQNNEEFDEEDDFSDCSLSSSLMHDDAENDEDVEWNTYESLNDVDEDYIVHKNDAKRVEECVTSFIEKIPTISRYQPELAVIYEETNTSDSKCSLKSILEETTAYTEPECERSDTPDTYVIEKEPTVEYNVYASVDKCIASTDALLEHVKNQKIDRNDSETGSSPVANCGPTLDNNGADSDAHTISDTSLISCLADSTEDLEALKNDGTCYDANDESEIVLDSGILMEDIITCSSEGDYTDMKLSSEVISTGIVSTLPPPEGRISSGSEEPEDAVWVTQIEKMFDFDVDDFCLVDLFAEPVEELSDDLGVVIDIGSDDQGHDAAELGDCADSITESADLSQDYLLVDAENDVEFSTFRPYRENIATDVRDLDNERLTESASSVDSVHTLILLNEPCADSKLLDENNLNAEVTLNVPETDTITETRDDAVTKPDSSEYLRQSCSCDQSDVHSNCEICKYIERSTETDSKATTKSRQDADFDFDVFDSVIIRILATENELPIGVDDTFIEYKNLKEVFGESFLDDSNIFAVSFENTPAIQNIAGCDDDDDENDENEDNFYSNDDKYVCHDCNMMDAAKFDSNVGTSEIIELEPSTHFDEENVSCVNDRVSSDLNVLLDRNEVMCETIVDDSMSQETPQDDDSEIKTAEFENQEVNCIDPSNVITVDDTIENGDSTKNPTPQSEVDFEPKNDDGELSGQLFDSQINNEEDFVAEENNNYLPVDDPNHGNVLVENDVVDEQSKCAEVFENDIDENDAINETESSIDLSENINDITVLEIDNEEFAECIASFENNGEVDNDGDRASENHDDESAVENNVSDDLSESSESIKSVKIINNVAAEECSESYTDVNGEHEYGSVAESKSSKSVESTENLGSVAGLKNLESTESLEERNVVGSDYDSVTVEPSKVAESEETTENIDSITSQKDSESIESLEENNIIGSDYDFVVEPSKVSTSEESTENIDENVTDQECSGSEESLENCPNVINDHKHGFEAESEPSESAESTENLDNATSQKDSESVVALEENNVVSSDSDSLDEEPSKLSQSLESTGNIDNVTSQKNSECTESLVESNVVGSDYDSVAVEPSEVSEFDESTENIDENVTNKRYSESEESLENCPNVINDHEHGSEAESEQSESAESTENLDNVTSQKDSESVEALEGTNDVSSDSDSVAEEPSKLPDSVESIKNIDYVTSQKDSESIESLEEDNGVSSDSNSVVEEPSTLSQSVELTENIDDNVTAENDANQEPSKQVVSTENIADVTEVGSNIVFGPEKIADLFETSDDVAMSESGVVFESAEPTESSVNFEDDLAAGNDVISEPEVPSEAAESDADDTCAENDFGQESSELRAQSDSSDDVAGNDVICESEVPSEATESNADYACRQKSSELHSQPDSSDDVVGNNVICEPEVPSEAAESNADDACAENDFGQELSELHEQSDSNDGDVGAANDVEGNENDVDDDENDVDGDENDVDGEENNVAGAENDIVYESSELVESVKASSENDAEPKISELPESSDNSDDGAGIKTDTFDESPESIQSVEDTDQLVTERNEVLSYPFDKVEIPKSSTNVDVAAKNIDQVPSGFVSSTENTDDVITVENNVSGDKGEFVENTETVETVEGNDIEGDDEFAEPTETDDDVVTVKNYSVDVPSMPAENETHSVESSDITTDSIDENRPESENNNFADATNNSNEEQATNSSREMGSNYVTLSDASSKPEDESGVLLDSPVKNQKTYARILEGSGKKRDLFDENTPPKSSPPVAQTKSPPLFKFKSEPNQLNNLKTSFRISRTAKRSSPSIPKSTEDGEDDTQRTNGIASATSSSTSSDEKKPKLEPDVTEYSVRLKLRIEWDNKQNSSDSTSKSSSFEDSLNCSESTSEGRRDLPNENHDRFEPVHRLTANFKNDYPKFISYEYFSPKVKISRTPRRTPSGAKRTVRKSISLESSPTGRYHRYCHLTSDFNATNKTPTPKRVSPSITTTTTTNVFQTNVKNSKNQLPRKAFQNKNTNLVTPLKTSTPVLNVAHQFAAKESSLIECLTTNTLSPIINSLEEFELIESLLTSCDK